MLKILAAIIGLIGPLWLPIAVGYGVAWYDRRPANTPVVHVLFFHWSPPNSLKAQRDAAFADLTQARANEAVLQTAINGQNASISRLSAASTAARAKSAQALASRQTALQRAYAAEAHMAAAGQGATPCARAQSVDDAFKETLQ